MLNRGAKGHLFLGDELKSEKIRREYPPPQFEGRVGGAAGEDWEAVTCSGFGGRGRLCHQPARIRRLRTTWRTGENLHVVRLV